MMSRLVTRLAARTEFRRGAALLHPECPIEQTVRGRDAAVQGQLMQEIWRQRAYVDDGALVVAEPGCLRVLARSEAALRPPVEALQRRYGEGLAVGPRRSRHLNSTGSRALNCDIRWCRIIFNG